MKSFIRKFKSIDKRYEGVNLCTTPLKGAYGEVDNITVYIETSALLVNYMDQIIDKTREFINKLHCENYLIDFLKVSKYNDFVIEAHCAYPSIKQPIILKEAFNLNEN